MTNILAIDAVTFDEISSVIESRPEGMSLNQENLYHKGQGQHPGNEIGMRRNNIFIFTLAGAYCFQGQ
jgi:hypothetical protein